MYDSFLEVQAVSLPSCLSPLIDSLLRAFYVGFHMRRTRYLQNCILGSIKVLHKQLRVSLGT
jgi:hypothetical protein